MRSEELSVRGRRFYLGINRFYFLSAPDTEAFASPMRPRRPGESKNETIIKNTINNNNSKHEKHEWYDIDKPMTRSFKSFFYSTKDTNDTISASR